MTQPISSHRVELLTALGATLNLANGHTDYWGIPGQDLYLEVGEVFVNPDGAIDITPRTGIGRAHLDLLCDAAADLAFGSPTAVRMGAWRTITHPDGRRGMAATVSAFLPPKMT